MNAACAAGQYQVRSQVSGCHTVDMLQPGCTCMDFKITKLPCKHFCAVFRFGRTSFLQLPTSYLNGPYVALAGTSNNEARERRLSPTEAQLELPEAPEAITTLSMPQSSSNQFKVKRASGRSLTQKFNSIAYYRTDHLALALEEYFCSLH